jgi:hypothetical protein
LRGGVEATALPPVDGCLDGLPPDPEDVGLHGSDDAVDQGVAQVVGLEAEVEEVLMLGVVLKRIAQRLDGGARV